MKFANDTVLELASRLDHESKKCLETEECQHIQSLIPIIDETLVLLDSTLTQSLGYQTKYEVQVEKIKTLSSESRHLKQELSKEREAHQDTIQEGDSQIQAISDEKKTSEFELIQLKKKIDKDQIQIQELNKNIIDIASETKNVETENKVLKISIENLKTQLLDYKDKLKSEPFPIIPTTSPNVQFHSKDINLPPCERIHIIGDSNVRNLGRFVSEYLPRGPEVFTSCIPRGGICQLTSCFIKYPTPGDLIFINSGTNDICSSPWPEIKSCLDNLLVEFNQCRFIILSVPQRYDKTYLNTHINKFNTLLKYAIQRRGNVQLIQTRRIITSRCMKKDGIHYSDNGKEKIATKIATAYHASTRTTLPPETECIPMVSPPLMSPTPVPMPD